MARILIKTQARLGLAGRRPWWLRLGYNDLSRAKEGHRGGDNTVEGLSEYEECDAGRSGPVWTLSGTEDGAWDLNRITMMEMIHRGVSLEVTGKKR